MLDHVQQRGDRPQVRRHRRLQREQRQDPLVHLEIAPVDPVVVVDDDRGQLDVLVLERLQRAVQGRDDEVEAAERLSSSAAQLVLEVLPAGSAISPPCRSRTPRSAYRRGS